jgi:hypothetical protein
MEIYFHKRDPFLESFSVVQICNIAQKIYLPRPELLYIPYTPLENIVVLL